MIRPSSLGILKLLSVTVQMSSQFIDFERDLLRFTLRVSVDPLNASSDMREMLVQKLVCRLSPGIRAAMVRVLYSSSLPSQFLFPAVPYCCRSHLLSSFFSQNKEPENLITAKKNLVQFSQLPCPARHLKTKFIALCASSLPSPQPSASTSMSSL